MTKKATETTQQQRDKALLVGVDILGDDNLLTLDDSLAELSALSETAGIEVVGVVTQRLSRPNPKTLIGSGKIDEIKAIISEVGGNIILFDNELSPRHQRELEKAFGDNFRVLDRTALILDIFAQHAHTREGALQVELAQYEYRLPRLTRAWTHLARQAGGGGGRAGGVGGVGLRGPGETQLEVDRRDIHRRISHLKQELEKVRAHRQRHRLQRQRSRIPVIALVGYTNAGKSTLLNRLSGANVYVADQLFATLDPTTRRIELPGGQTALVSDTVGFIQKLPTNLIAAFRATLEEIAEADLLLHVVDVTHPNALAQVEAVQQVLEEIEADHIPTLMVLNKIDCLNQPNNYTAEHFPGAVAISALKGVGIADLLLSIKERLYEDYVPLTVKIPYWAGELVSLFHEQGQVERVVHERKDVIIQGYLPGRLLAKFSSFSCTDKPIEELNEPINS